MNPRPFQVIFLISIILFTQNSFPVAAQEHPGNVMINNEIDFPDYYLRNSAFYQNYIYLSNDRNQSLIYDVSDETNPSFVGSFGSRAMLVKVSGEILLSMNYISNGSVGVIDIWSLSDPTNPSLISSIETSSKALHFDVLGSTVAILQSHSRSDDNSRAFNELLIYDIDDATQPNLVGSTILEFRSTFAVYSAINDIILSTTHVFLTNVMENVIIVNLENLNEVNFITENVEERALRDLLIIDDVLYVADNVNGIFSYDVSDPSQPIFLDRTFDHQSTLASNGLYLFAGYTLNITVVYDISNPSDIQEVETIYFSGRAYSLEFNGNHLYAILNNVFTVGGFEIIDGDTFDIVSTTYILTNHYRGIHVFKNHLFVLHYILGLMIFENALTQRRPDQIIYISDENIELFGHENLLFIKSRDKLYIYDISAFDNINLLRKFDSVVRATLKIQDMSLYVLFSDSLEIFDIKEITKIKSLGKLEFNMVFQHALLAVGTDRLFISDTNEKLIYSIEITDLSNPQLQIEKVETVHSVNSMLSVQDVLIIGHSFSSLYYKTFDLDFIVEQKLGFAGFFVGYSASTPIVYAIGQNGTYILEKNDESFGHVLLIDNVGFSTYGKIFVNEDNLFMFGSDKSAIKIYSFINENDLSKQGTEKKSNFPIFAVWFAIGIFVLKIIIGRPGNKKVRNQ